jgi:hypothetical protein
MDDSKPAGNVLPMKPLSMSMRKKLLNASLARVKISNDEFERIKQQEAYKSHQLANACSVLEAMVRRYGEQVFDRAEVEATCRFGRIKWVVTDKRITLMLDPEKSDAPPLAPLDEP